MRKFWLAPALLLVVLAVFWLWNDPTASEPLGPAIGLATANEPAEAPVESLHAAEIVELPRESTRRSPRVKPPPQSSLTSRVKRPQVVARTFRFDSMNFEIELTGRVEQGDGQPAAEESIWVGVVPREQEERTNGIYRSFDLEVQTGANGEFRTRLSSALLRGSEIQVFVHRKSAGKSTQGFSAAGRFEGPFLAVSHELELGTARLIESDPLLAGVCRSRTGEALAGVQVSAVGLAGTTTAVTDDEGRFELRSRMTVDTYLNVSGSRVAPLTEPIAVRCGDLDVEIFAPLLGSVVGTHRVWGEEDPWDWGHRLDRILPEEAGRTSDPDALSRPMIRSDPFGRFRFQNVEPGHYRYTLTPPRGFPFRVGDLVVVPDTECSAPWMQQIDPTTLFGVLSLEVRNAEGERVETARLWAATVDSEEEWVRIDERLHNFLVPSKFEGQSRIQAPGYEPRTFSGWPEGTIVLEATD